ncbi:proline-, glutamic acid- and leucine-rich protein 1-like [Anopheles bellator]|uniref:proline-, glutamic acid- and leucine-rich protein 1-like n=1 Tax=Anopheles bellator TaxID=139047 RepID=UPI0026494E1C|nr:proline-, glutamic acid- and leucine-rich protein 1-like [Anopheles bellator]
MEGVGQLFSSAVQSADGHLLSSFLSSLEEHQTFWTDPQNDLEAILANISSLLANANSRDKALRALCDLVPNCPNDILEEKAQHYINMCVKVYTQGGSTQSVSLSFTVLQKLLLKSLHSSDIRKLFVSSLATMLEPIGSTLKKPVVPSVLAFLALAMRHYAGVCGSLKSRIEQFLYSLVDTTDRETAVSVAECLLLLQQIRGGGQHGTLHKKTWEEYYRKLIDTVHDLLNRIFAHTPETFDEETELECFKFRPLSSQDDPLAAAQLIVTRTNNLILFLQQAIIGAYPVPKPIAPFRAVNLILRGLSVTCGAMNQNPIVENIAYGTYLPVIQRGLLAVFDGLVLTLGSHMFMYADLICTAFVKCLRATQHPAGRLYGRKKNFILLRTKLYRSIGLWCETLRYGSCIETVNEPILEQIIRDITPYEAEVMLKIDAGSQKRLSSKAKRKLQKEQNAATALNQAYASGSTSAESKEQLVDAGNEILCQGALVCLSSILQSAGCFIKPVTHKLLQEKIVPLCFSLVTNQSQSTGLYREHETRIALLRSFAALIVNPHHHCPPPLQYAGEIFKAFQTHDPSAAVRSCANELARTMELIMHPWKETLYFPADQAAIKDALANKEKHPLASLAKVQIIQQPSNGQQEVIGTCTESSKKRPLPSKQSPTKSNDILDDSEGEINESLAVTEASDIEGSDIEENAIHEEPQGWVEEVSIISVDQPEKNSAKEAPAVLNENEGVIHSTTDDEKIIESSVVSIEDSDEDDRIEVIPLKDSDDDDVVVIPLDSGPAVDHSENIVETPMRQEEKEIETDPSSPKKAKLSETENGNDSSKSIDAIVAEMVAEFVDEP